ncbi:MAG: hypothetical protein IPH04_00530 [Saprospirales bacterium]|nr:hypothetical protein [Saprospirales bacterium]MBK7335988.1 hypothetical protein [Saprospirales bacterium]
MKLKKLPKGEAVDAEIEEAAGNDLRQILRSKNFLFDWQFEKKQGLELYKLYLAETGQIVGLMSLADIPEEFRIHLNLIESSKENIGKDKQIDHIPGALIAFACELAFKRGYDGFVSLVPKTKLIDLYKNKYGFEQYGRMLATEGTNSLSLIIKYLEDGR